MTTKETDHMEYWMITVVALYEEEAKTDGSIWRIWEKAAVDIDDINLPHDAQSFFLDKEF